MPYLVQKYNKCTREITSLTGSSSHEELNRPGTFWRNHTTATPTVGYDSLIGRINDPRKLAEREGQTRKNPRQAFLAKKQIKRHFEASRKHHIHSTSWPRTCQTSRVLDRATNLRGLEVRGAVARLGSACVGRPPPPRKTQPVGPKRTKPQPTRRVTYVRICVLLGFPLRLCRARNYSGTPQLRRSIPHPKLVTRATIKVHQFFFLTLPLNLGA